MRVGSTPYVPPFRALDVQVATLERLQAAGFASSPTNVPVKPVSAAPGEAKAGAATQAGAESRLSSSSVTLAAPPGTPAGQKA